MTLWLVTCITESAIAREETMSAAQESDEIPSVPYFLVLLIPSSNHRAASEHFAAHVAFIEAMAAAHVVLLGGDFDSAVEGAEAAYLLHTNSRDEAQAWAAKDPFVTHAVYRPRVVAWNLVGVDPGAVDPALAG
jgi:uncharacterized protein YciI